MHLSLPEGWRRKRKGNAMLYLREGLERAVVDSPFIAGYYYDGKVYDNLADAMYNAEFDLHEIPT